MHEVYDDPKMTIEVLSGVDGYSLVMDGKVVAGPKPRADAVPVHVFKADLRALRDGRAHAGTFPADCGLERPDDVLREAVQTAIESARTEYRECVVSCPSSEDAEEAENRITLFALLAKAIDKLQTEAEVVGPYRALLFDLLEAGEHPGGFAPHDLAMLVGRMKELLNKPV